MNESSICCGYPAIFFVQFLATAFMAVLFLQSGLDKVFNYRDNRDYFSKHFKNSPLGPLVWLLTPLITLLETAAGVLSLAGLVALINGNNGLAWWGQVLAAVSLLSLFFGQRLAKDYAGAAALVPYFLVSLAGLWLLGQ